MDEEMMLENALYPWLDDASMEAQDGGEECFSASTANDFSEDEEEYDEGGEG